MAETDFSRGPQGPPASGFRKERWAAQRLLLPPTLVALAFLALTSVLLVIQWQRQPLRPVPLPLVLLLVVSSIALASFWASRRLGMLVRQERVLREVANAIAGARRVEDVTQLIARAAVDITHDEVDRVRSLGGLASVTLQRMLLMEEAQLRSQALHESEARFRSLAENASDAIITIDEHDQVHYVNPAAERVFGYTIEEILRTPFTERMPERMRGAHRQGLQRYIATGKRRISWSGIELPGLTKDGREIPLEVSFGVYTRGGLHLFTGIMRDISARRHAEEERTRLLEREQAARQEAEAAARRMHFLAEASHALASSLDQEATLRTVARLAVPELADGCVIDVLAGERKVHRAVVIAADPRRQELLEVLQRDYAPGWDSPHPSARVLRTGEALLLSHLSSEALIPLTRDAGHQRIVEALEVRSLMVVPLRARADAGGPHLRHLGARAPLRPGGLHPRPGARRPRRARRGQRPPLRRLPAGGARAGRGAVHRLP